MGMLYILNPKSDFTGPVAQPVEQRPFKPLVVGSIPTGLTIIISINTITKPGILPGFSFL